MRRLTRGATTPGTNAGSFAPTAKAETDVLLTDDADWDDADDPDEYPQGWGLDPATLTPEQAWDAVQQGWIVARYTQGDCHLLAHKVAEQTGWGLVIVGDAAFEVDYCDDDCPAGCTDPEHGSYVVENLFHAWARRPDGRLVDIRGVHEPEAAERLAETWGAPIHAYVSAVEADRVWAHEQWAETEEDLDDADYTAAYVARFGADLPPLDPSEEGWD